jgi:hypothetical protein
MVFTAPLDEKFKFMINELFPKAVFWCLDC